MPEDLQPVMDTLRSGFVAEGPRVAEFEEAIAPVVGSFRTVALNSGTSALHLALHLAGVKLGSRVITTPITSPATNVSIPHFGAGILWADVDPRTGNISPASAKRLLDMYEPGVSAVIAVDWGGYPCDMDALATAVDGRCPVIEDAAHSLGATYEGRPVGSLAHFTCFSFQAIKHITTIDGGLLVCRKEDDYRRARRLRWFGVDRDRKGRAWDDDFEEAGYKFHMNDVSAALGLLQLPELPAILRRRRKIATRYRTAFAEVEGLEYQRSDYACEPAYWLFTVLVERRGDFIKALDAAGIDASPVHFRNDFYAAFARCTAGNDTGADTTWFDSRMVCIPVGEWMADEDVDRVIEAVQGGW